MSNHTLRLQVQPTHILLGGIHPVQIDRIDWEVRTSWNGQPIRASYTPPPASLAFSGTFLGVETVTLPPGGRAEQPIEVTISGTARGMTAGDGDVGPRGTVTIGPQKFFIGLLPQPTQVVNVLLLPGWDGNAYVWWVKPIFVGTQ